MENEALKTRVTTWVANAERNRDHATDCEAAVYYQGMVDAYMDMLRVL